MKNCSFKLNILMKFLKLNERYFLFQTSSMYYMTFLNNAALKKPFLASTLPGRLLRHVYIDLALFLKQLHVIDVPCNLSGNSSDEQTMCDLTMGTGSTITTSLLRGLGGKTPVGENETEVNASGRGPSNANLVSADEIKEFLLQPFPADAEVRTAFIAVKQTNVLL